MKNNNSSSKQNILLVGGGTGGHIFPLYPLAKALIKNGKNVHLIVNESPLDRQVIADKFNDLSALKAHYLRTHKIDYHLSLRNLITPFKILGSLFRTKKLIKKIKPDTVFFKGGFVGFPVLVALKYIGRFKGKIYLHDSDISAGALTRLIGKSAEHIFSNFGPQATPLFYWPSKLHPGMETSKCAKPSRDELSSKKPEILVFGGSQGAQFLNNLITQDLEQLTQNFEINLIAGPKNKITTKHKNLITHQFMPQDELIQKMIEADVVICRSGASMFQVLAAQTKCIAVPLPSSARNHQYQNAQYFADKGLCYLLEQNNQTAEKLNTVIEKILADTDLNERLKTYEGLPQVKKIIEKII